MGRVIAALCAAILAVTGVIAGAAVPAHAASTVIVTFVANGGTTPTPLAIQVTAGRSLASEGRVFPSTARTGYTLTGWTPTADGSGEPYSAATPVKRSIVLYAQWAANSPVTVSFAASRGSLPSPSSLTVYRGQSVSDAGRMPELTRKGFVFAGWNTAANGTGDPFDETSPIFEDMWVYAQWVIEDSEQMADRLRARSQVTPAVSQIVWRQVGVSADAPWAPVVQGDVSADGVAGHPEIPAGAVFVVVTSADPVHAPSRNVAAAEEQAHLLANGFGGQVGETVQGRAWRGPARIVATW